jgi:hypothetical protein
MTFVRRLFFSAGIYGLLVLVPMYFMADRLGAQYPPAINHREFYYGFIGVAVAWQVLFLILATDPRRYRPMIIPAILEKLGYGIVVLVMMARGEIAGGPAIGGIIDLVLAALFAYAFVRIGREYR